MKSIFKEFSSFSVEKVKGIVFLSIRFVSKIRFENYTFFNRTIEQNISGIDEAMCLLLKNNLLTDTRIFYLQAVVH